ncbi:hypothetical protein ACFE04_002191 [Oxalis oulophora]
MIEWDLEPDLVLYSTMIHLLVEARKFKKVMRLFDDMTKRGKIPDIYCYNPLNKGFCDMGLFNKAWFLQCEMAKRGCLPNDHTYTILICGMCKVGLVREAEKLFSKMQELGCFADVVTWNSLMYGLCEAGELKRPKRLFHEMDMGRDKNPNKYQILHNESLETTVKELCESGLVLKECEILKENADIGVMPNIKTYGILIDAFCKEGHPDQAVVLFNELHLKELSPNSITYEILINGLYKAGREDDALGYYDKMMENNDTPSAYTCKLVMIWLCKKKKFVDAFNRWLSYLKSLGCDGEAIKNIERHFEKGEIDNVVLGLLKMDFKLQKIDSDPYTIWLIGFCRAGSVEEALQIYNVLVNYNINVTAPSCVLLIRCLCKKRRLDVALEVFFYALSKGFSLTPPIRYQLLRSILRSMPRFEHRAASSRSLP